MDNLNILKLNDEFKSLLAKKNVLIAMPTINSHSYILKTLNRIYNELLLINKFTDCELLICLNGTNDDYKTKNLLLNFKKNNSEINIILHEEIIGGKNNAINIMIDYAKNNNKDIIHFIDDDIDFKPKSILINIITLIEKEIKYKVPFLIGSNFLVKPHDLNHFRKYKKSFIKVLVSYFSYKISSVPFNKKSDKSRFCSAQSLCMSVNTIPKIPKDLHRITDDTYWTNYYAIKGKEIFKKYGEYAVHKPEDSIVYFEASSSIREWIKQQVRIYSGVKAAFDYFKYEKEFIYKFNLWSYAFIKEYKKRIPKNYSFIDHFYYFLYSIFIFIIVRKANKKIKKEKSIDWAIAKSTKK